MAKAGLRKVTKTVRTKKGTVKRSYWVKAQGPQPKATLRSADASSGKAASRGRIIGGLLGSALGGTVGVLGGAAFGTGVAHHSMLGQFTNADRAKDAFGRTNMNWVATPNAASASQQMREFTRNHTLRAGHAYASGAARGAMVFGAGGAASGAVVGALMGHVVGRAIDRRRARK